MRGIEREMSGRRPPSPAMPSLSLCRFFSFSGHKLTCSSFSGFLDTAVTSASWPSSSQTSVPAAEVEKNASSPPWATAVDVGVDKEHE